MISQGLFGRARSSRTRAWQSSVIRGLAPVVRVIDHFESRNRQARGGGALREVATETKGPGVSCSWIRKASAMKCGTRGPRLTQGYIVHRPSNEGIARTKIEVIELVNGTMAPPVLAWVDDPGLLDEFEEGMEADVMRSPLSTVPVGIWSRRFRNAHHRRSPDRPF